MMVIENKFEINEFIYLKSDPEQRERLIVQIAVGGNGSIRYCVSCGTMETWHYDMEMTKEKDQLKTFHDH
jgi:hypothetical protein